MQIVCIANQKGGVGKTTVTAGLAGALAAAGQRVLMIDLDPQASLSHWFNRVAEPAIAGAYDLYDSVARPLSAVTHATGENAIALIPAQAALATLERTAATRAGLGGALVRAFANARSNYDYALLDCPPAVGVLMVSALAVADLLIVPTQTEPMALRALESMQLTASRVERSRQRRLPLAIVPSMYDRRTRVGQDCMVELRTRFAATVWHEEIPIDTRLREASRHRATPATFDAGSRGALAFTKLASWLSQRGDSLAPFTEAHAA